jgi:hypothetical protein
MNNQNPYYHWVMPNYVVDYNNNTPRYDYLRYPSNNYDTNANFNQMAAAAAAYQSNQLWNNYMYQQQSTQPRQVQQQHQPVQQQQIDNFQISPVSAPYIPISLQMPKTDPNTPLVTPTKSRPQMSATKSTTDDPLGLKTQETSSNFLRTSYYDPYAYNRQQGVASSHQTPNQQPQQTQYVDLQKYYGKNSNFLNYYLLFPILHNTFLVKIIQNNVLVLATSVKRTLKGPHDTSQGLAIL